MIFQKSCHISSLANRNQSSTLKKIDFVTALKFSYHLRHTIFRAIKTHSRESRNQKIMQKASMVIGNWKKGSFRVPFYDTHSHLDILYDISVELYKINHSGRRPTLYSIRFYIKACDAKMIRISGDGFAACLILVILPVGVKSILFWLYESIILTSQSLHHSSK